MATAVSKTSLVRAEIEKEPEAPVKEIMDRVWKNHRVRVTDQLVYNVRSTLRSKSQKKSDGAKKGVATRAVNESPLREHIRKALGDRNLFSNQIATACREQGYKSDEATYRQHLAKKLRLMESKGEITKLEDGSFVATVVVPQAPYAPSTKVHTNSPGGELDALMEAHALTMKIGGVRKMEEYVSAIKTLAGIEA